MKSTLDTHASVCNVNVHRLHVLRSYNQGKHTVTQTVKKEASTPKEPVHYSVMDSNPFSIESILKKNSSSPADNTEEPQPSKSTEALSLAVKLAGKL